MYIKQIIIIIGLLLIANLEWLFIGMNYDIFVKLKEIQDYKSENVQDTYIDALVLGIPLDEKKIGLDIYNENYGGFNFNSLKMPSFDIDAPVITTNRGIEEALNRGVVNFSPKGKEGKYLFGHSSSKVEGPYSFIFTRIVDLEEGNIVSLESDSEVRLYKYKDFYYKKPEKLDELSDGKDKLFLITCYPFNTTITRYVVELELDQIILK